MSQVRIIFEKQGLHALFLIGLLLGLVLLTRIDSLQGGQVWAISTLSWLWIAVGLAVAHQVFVWLCWRMQLHLSALSRVFGGRGFTIYAVIFAILGISRVVAVFILGLSNRGTLPVEPTLLRVLAIIVLIPAAYLFYSVKRYFGFKRAFGIDHFDHSYRSLPFVREGIFRFTRNGMYVFGFFLFWVPGLWYASVAALCVALFNHLYIWIHYYVTELPDMRHIYGEAGAIGANRP